MKRALLISIALLFAWKMSREDFAPPTMLTRKKNIPATKFNPSPRKMRKKYRPAKVSLAQKLQEQRKFKKIQQDLKGRSIANVKVRAEKVRNAFPLEEYFTGEPFVIKQRKYTPSYELVAVFENGTSSEPLLKKLGRSFIYEPFQAESFFNFVPNMERVVIHQGSGQIGVLTGRIVVKTNNGLSLPPEVLSRVSEKFEHINTYFITPEVGQDVAALNQTLNQIEGVSAEFELLEGNLVEK